MRRMIDTQSENTIMHHERHIAAELGVRPEQVAAAVALLDEGNTIPFIARYRKEVTGTLDEEQLRHVAEQIERRRALDQRRAAVLASVEEQGKLTAELQAQLEAAANMTALEDLLYAPYRPKRRTRAGIAREKGLGPLADLILAQPRTTQTAAQLARPYVSEAAPTVEDALAGARDIVAEAVNDHAAVRGRLRQRAMQVGVLRSQRIEDAPDERGVYTLYYDFEMALACPACGPIRCWPSTAAKRRRCCASVSPCPKRSGCWPPAPPSGPTASRRWPNNCNWRWTTPPSGCCCRPWSATPAAP